MTVNPGVARFEQHAHETLAQMQDTLRTFQRVVGPSCRTHLVSLTDFLLSQGKPMWRALRQRIDEALSRQSHLRLLATRARRGVYVILLQSEPFLHSIRHLYGTRKNRKTLLTFIVAAFAGLALIIMLVKMGMSNQAGNEHAGSVNATKSGLTQAPDWTIFDDAFANQPTRLATSEFGAALTQEPAKTTGQLMREPVPLPRPRPKRAGRE